MNRGELYRYDGADPTTRRLLATGLELGSQYCSIALSPDEREVYFARGSYIWAIDADTGDQRVVFNIAGGLGRGIAVYTPPKPGDLNCDNWVNNFDIDPFVLALTDEEGYAARFGWCDRSRADMNADGAINSFDIDGFVAAVVGDTGE
ncbi:MAG: hypothetical protein JNG88_00690 [Phycisphaerales bacterium]|nr:hypothetical protein [Phycisphaerales bacterium]